MRDLLYGLMLCSGNDCAVQIAETVGGSYENFIDMMNQKANELGLKNTHFETPHGLDDDKHYTTAYELALLTDYAMNNKQFAQIVNTKKRTIQINGYSKTINNTNELLGYMSGVNGVKTGFTGNAGRCLVISCKRNNLELISVVLGADTKKFRTKDSIKILEYAYKNYYIYNIKAKVTREFNEWKKDNIIVIKRGKEEYIVPQTDRIILEEIPITSKEESNLKIAIECKDTMMAPVYKGEKVGTVNVSINNENIMKLDLILPRTICKLEFEDYLTLICKELSRVLFSL